MPATFPAQLAILQKGIIDNTSQCLLPLSMFGGQFTSQKVYCGQEVIGKVMDNRTAKIDTNCCPAGGWDFCQQDDPTGMVHDVPFKMDTRIYDFISLKKCVTESGQFSPELFRAAQQKMAEAIARGVLDHILAGINEAAFPAEWEEETDDVDHDTLVDVATAFNEKCILSGGRNMILNSKAAGNLSRDYRLGSMEYFGQTMEGRQNTMRLRHYSNVETFDNVLEYPRLDDLTEGRIGFAFHPNAIRYQLAVPDNHDEFLRALGLTPQNQAEYVTDPVTGLTMKFTKVVKDCTQEVFFYAEVILGVDYGGQFGDTNLSDSIIRITDTNHPNYTP